MKGEKKNGMKMTRDSLTSHLHFIVIVTSSSPLSLLELEVLSMDNNKAS